MNPRPEHAAAALLAVLAACGCWLALAGAAELPLPVPSGRAAPRCVGEGPLVVAADPVGVRARIEVAPAAEAVAALAVNDRTPELEAIVARLAAGDADHDRVRELRDLLVATADLAARVPELLAKAEEQDLTARRLLQALELAGTAKCQQALAQIAADARSAKQNRVQAIAALGRMPEPGASTMERLLAFTERGGDGELARAALLAFGRAAATVRATDCVRGTAAATALARALQGATSSAATVAALQAIARSSDANLNATVAAFVWSADAGVRAAAADAVAATGG